MYKKKCIHTYHIADLKSISIDLLQVRYLEISEYLEHCLHRKYYVTLTANIVS